MLGARIEEDSIEPLQSSQRRVVMVSEVIGLLEGWGKERFSPSDALDSVLPLLFLATPLLDSKHQISMHNTASTETSNGSSEVEIATRGVRVLLKLLWGPQSFGNASTRAQAWRVALELASKLHRA